MRLPPKFRRRLADLADRVINVYSRKSYSQEGEDLFLERLFGKQVDGFYVDVGAHHPRRFSNTYLFYAKGWTGINIEPNPDAIHRFFSERSRDTNLQLGVSDVSTTLTYYSFDEPALNTFEKSLVDSRLKNTPYRVSEELEIRVERLDNILKQYLPPNRKIDFLSIDVEGRDFAVLQSNDWTLFRPRCVLVEALGKSVEENLTSEIFLFMKSSGYKLLGKTFNTLVFVDEQDGSLSPSKAGI
jgi:FkbM family methyltransferase